MNSAGLRLLRPRQWAKGLLVFAAPLFTGRLFDAWAIERALLAFVAIALISSAVYVVNDLRDVERDKLHPRKSKRPLASGAISKSAAAILGVICLISGAALAAYMGRGPLVVVAVYLALQLFYNFGGKNMPVTDVFLLASGYVLRAALGAAVIWVSMSGWLLLCTGALALMVGIAKRRSEFVEMQGTEFRTRAALAGYTRESLDVMLACAAATAAISYGIYTLDSETARHHPALIITAVWVFYGIFRYMLLTVAKNEGGEPEALFLRDPHLLAAVGLFFLSALLAMHGFALPLLEVPR